MSSDISLLSARYVCLIALLMNIPVFYDIALGEPKIPEWTSETFEVINKFRRGHSP